MVAFEYGTKGERHKELQRLPKLFGNTFKKWEVVVDEIR